MMWKDQPSGNGYYWFREEDAETRIVEVWGEYYTVCGDDMNFRVSGHAGLWYGPLEAPK